MTHCLWCFEEIIHHVNWSTLFHISKPTTLCRDCAANIEPITGHHCLKCNRPQNDKGICYDCERWEAYYEQDDPLQVNYSLYTYNDFMQAVITKWKYRGDYCLREIFRTEFNDAITQFVKREKLQPILIPIPLSTPRTKERGFNQATAIAELVDKAIIQHVLTRTHSEKQSKMNRYSRMHTDNPFTIKKSLHQSVIVIDDIYTTGRTLRHAASLLKAAGAKKVYAFTLVRG